MTAFPPKRIWVEPGYATQGMWWGVEQPGFPEYVPASQWQPIETAPKDGTFVMGFHTEWDWPAPVCWLGTSGRQYGSGAGWFTVKPRYDDEPQYPLKQPTHWMPLPEPPEAE